jgi:hypothetical protein
MVVQQIISSLSFRNLIANDPSSFGRGDAMRRPSHASSDGRAMHGIAPTNSITNWATTHPHMERGQLARTARGSALKSIAVRIAHPPQVRSARMHGIAEKKSC